MLPRRLGRQSAERERISEINSERFFELQAFQGFGYGLIFTAVTSWAVENIPEVKQSTRMGLFQSLYSAGMFLGPVLIGILIEVFSRSTGYLIMGALSIASTILINTSKNAQKKKLLMRISS
ncbi:MFS transporter [Peribacillus simplex]|uniref:MFS transporter n=1 Tax=Peribacillus simplex TaxID=1478 RepID=UPI00203BAE1E|nr:MFS transporter [Peribacillus simplex]MCM3673889.1 MFS transporter [Peribacillus simplex]